DPAVDQAMDAAETEEEGEGAARQQGGPAPILDHELQEHEEGGGQAEREHAGRQRLRSCALVRVVDVEEGWEEEREGWDVPGEAFHSRGGACSPLPLRRKKSLMETQ